MALTTSSSSTTSFPPSPTRSTSTTSPSLHNYAFPTPHYYSQPSRDGRSFLSPSTTSKSHSHHNSASTSPPSTSSSPQTVGGFVHPDSSYFNGSGFGLPPPRQLPPIRPPTEYFSYIPPPPALPPAYHHPNLDKMSMASVVSPHAADTPKISGSMTTREWVVPPRPKPGRKPATDTPPTKRKAQNRAAQRAFRERRAARVGELEEQLEQEKEDYDKRESEHKDRIHQLEMDVQSFKSRCELLDGLLQKERQDRVKAETELEGFKNRKQDGRTFLPDQRSSHRSHSAATPSHHEPSPSAGPQLPSMDPGEAFTCGSCAPGGRCACAESVVKSVESGCGKCGPSTDCQCLDESLKPTGMPDLKRAPSPSLASAEKRQRSDSHAPETPYETDFTSFFKKATPAPIQPTMPSEQVKDPCGFCKEGDYCVCADTPPVSATTALSYDTHLPYPQQQVQTPPPSEDDVMPPMPMEINSDGAVKLHPRPQATSAASAAAATAAMAPSTSRGCGPKGPGTCAQCVADPISGLFCRALSASLKGTDKEGGCCGGAGRNGGCCKSGGSKSNGATPAKTLPSIASKDGGFGLSLSCAEAYQTLSNHRNFDKATDDIASWLPKLRAAPKLQVNGTRALPSPNASSSRLPIEVEAASIMSVLKDFDIRFGRGL